MSGKHGTIAAAMVLRLVRLLEQRAGEERTSRALSEVGLTREALAPGDARVPYEVSDRLLELAAAELGTSGLGLALSRTTSEESYGLAGLLLVTGPSFRRGLSRSLAYQRLWGDGERFRLVQLELGCGVEFRHPGGSALAAAVTAECALAEVMQGVRELVDEDAEALAVELSHAAMGDVSELSDYFGVEPRFDAARNRLTLASSLVDRPLRGLRDWLGQALERQAAKALELLPARDSVPTRVRALLAGEAGVVRSLEEVAQALSMSPRTLQRRLKLEGCSFQELLDAERLRLVTELTARGIPAKEAAFRAGFQDPSGLVRARRRWRR